MAELATATPAPGYKTLRFWATLVLTLISFAAGSGAIHHSLVLQAFGWAVSIAGMYGLHAWIPHPITEGTSTAAVPTTGVDA